MYLLTVLNLVSGANRTAFTECHRSVSWLPPSCDLFDMLWASLWFIGLDAAVQTQFPPGLFAADLVGGGHRRSLVLDTATTATATSSSSNALATSAFGGTGTGDVNTQQGYVRRSCRPSVCVAGCRAVSHPPRRCLCFCPCVSP